MVALAGLFLFGMQNVLANEIANLQFPQNIIADEGQVYYIANANGDPGTRENKGFIIMREKSQHSISSMVARNR